jgi:hypothetical protein
MSFWGQKHVVRNQNTKIYSCVRTGTSLLILSTQIVVPYHLLSKL